MKKLSYVVWDAEKPSKSCTLIESISLPNGISLKTTSGYIALIIVFCDELEFGNKPSFHICLDYRMENNMKKKKISTESPFKDDYIFHASKRV